MKEAVFEAIKRDIQVALANLDEAGKGLLCAGMIGEFIDVTLDIRPKLSKREINSRITSYVVHTMMLMWPSRDALNAVIDTYCAEHPSTGRALKLLAQLTEHYNSQLKK